LLTPHQKSKQYGLQEKDISADLHAQLMALEEWSTTTVALDRAGYKPLANVTFNKVKSHITGFLGFVSSYHGVPKPALGLLTFAEPTFHTSYMSFMVARGHQGPGLAVKVLVAMRVARYLMAVFPWVDPKFTSLSSNRLFTIPHLLKLEAWLSNLAQQVPAAAVVHSQWRISDGSSLPTGPELMAWMLATQRELFEDLTCVPQAWTAANVALAREIAYLIFCFGWLPPIRANCIRVLHHPLTSLQPGKTCTKPDCKVVGCKGNRLAWVDASDKGKGLTMTLSSKLGAPQN
jgi:hypothetical protein